MREAMLALLAKEPAHGYELRRAWRPRWGRWARCSTRVRCT